MVPTRLITLAITLPVLLSITTGQRWFFVVDLLGTVAFALSGVVLARMGGYDVFGALVLALLPAVGGGVVRDIVVNRFPVGVARSPWYMLAIIITVATGYLLLKLLRGRELGEPRMRPPVRLMGGWSVDQISRHLVVQGFDALGLAAFTVIGVIVAVETQGDPAPALGTAARHAGGGGRRLLRAPLSVARALKPTAEVG